ncbi:MAG: T9SS type A sorting domain-containing protein [Bacteroidaceae bacterium]|nr:T9SS type A sorting domain-containing protein [Prevotellaceae bacterium]MDY5632321.1 T9SS type A sorting domain-containing protein [Bacteroidaceae bacterium]
MVKCLPIIALGILLTAAPLRLAAQNEREDVETELPSTAVSVTVQGTRLRIGNADGEVVRVFSITGTEVKVLRIEGNDVTINLGNLPRGSYIIKVGNVVRKVAIR